LIYNLSPHRSATQSVTRFAEVHGLKATHWLGEEFDEFVGRLEVSPKTEELWALAKDYLNAELLSDLPWPLLYREAARDYPDAKFFLIRRDPVEWIKSVRKHTEGREMSYLEKWFYWTICWPGGTLIAQYSDDGLWWGYTQFIEGAKKHLGDRLTVFCLDDPHLSERLADFMGIRMVHPMEKIP
jgi:Sulfotransferase domain